MSFALPARRVAAVLFAAAVLAVGAPTMAGAAAPAPVGRLESVAVTAFSNAVVMTGWALDPAARNRPSSVQVTVDGRAAGGWRLAAVNRVDVNRSYGASGGHGFSITTTVVSGHHTVCLTARTSAAAGPTNMLGCFVFQAYPAATRAQMLATAKTIDPHGTIAWSWTALPTGTSARAEPWNRTIRIGSGNTTRYLRAVMLHEWSHVLQYRAFPASDPWWDAVQAFNALQGHPTDRQSYDGVEHGADCIARALGADHLGYGCPAALAVYGARIARGEKMNQPTGRLESARVSGRTVTLTGWALDSTRPTTAGTVQIINSGVPVGGRVTTGVTRSVINATLGVTGRHGFTIAVTLPAGSHRLCASASPIAAGQPTVTLPGCTLLTIS